MLTILLFILILGVLIFVHELGHFLVARRNGITAHEFGFGFPPRAFGFVRNEKTGKWMYLLGNKYVETKNTIYSLNWIPIGGFVKIKGEDGSYGNQKDSFAHKSAWTRTRVLAAGVTMNFILAWLLISIGLAIGAPEAVDNSQNNIPNTRIQVSDVVPKTPAEGMGLKIGDEIVKKQTSLEGLPVTLNNVESLQNYINSQKGKEIKLQVIRGSENLTVHGTPRTDSPDGQGPLGISLAETKIIKYPLYLAIWKGLLSTLNLIAMILVAFVGIIKSLFMGRGVGADVAGPVGIAVLTKQVAGLGLVYLLNFTALLSVNLGIINALPIPALDGGRIFFIVIEKIKGSPVSQRVEQAFHTIFFVLLITLMVVVTFRDVSKFIK